MDALRSHLQQHLPDYMLPSAYIWLSKIPLTPNSKIDRGALPEPGSERPPLSGRFEGPRNADERAIAEIWQTTLGLERVGVHDNFFDLGGSSMTILRVKDRVERRFQLRVPTVVFFQYPIVSGLAKAVAAMAHEKSGRKAANIGSRTAPAGKSANRRATGAVAPPPSSSSDIAVIGMAGRFPVRLMSRTCG